MTAEKMDDYMQQYIATLQGVELETMPAEESPEESKAADRAFEERREFKNRP